MKLLKTLNYIALALLLAAVIGLSIACNHQRNEIKFQKQQITELSANLKNAINKTAISFSIAPEITNKVTSAFGSTKNVTLQYYFTLDGQAIIMKPDSIYYIEKEY